MADWMFLWKLSFCILRNLLHWRYRYFTKPFCTTSPKIVLKIMGIKWWNWSPVLIWAYMHHECWSSNRHVHMRQRVLSSSSLLSIQEIQLDNFRYNRRVCRVIVLEDGKELCSGIATWWMVTPYYQYHDERRSGRGRNWWMVKENNHLWETLICFMFIPDPLQP